MAKPSLLDEPPEGEETSGTNSEMSTDAVWNELKKRFLGEDPKESKDAFAGLCALCEQDEDKGEYGKGEKPSLMIGIK